jgi:hypothetical protein
LRRLAVGCPQLLRRSVSNRYERPGHDPVEEIGLPRLEGDQTTEHVEKVQEVRAGRLAIASTNAADSC